MICKEGLNFFIIIFVIVKETCLLSFSLANLNDDVDSSLKFTKVLLQVLSRDLKDFGNKNMKDAGKNVSWWLMHGIDYTALLQSKNNLVFTNIFLAVSCEVEWDIAALLWYPTTLPWMQILMNE